MPKQTKPTQKPDHDFLPSIKADYLVADIPTTIKPWLRRSLGRPFYPTDKISISLHLDRNAHRRKLDQFLRRKGFTKQDIKRLTQLLGSRWSSR